MVLAIAWFTSAAVMYSTLSGLNSLSTGQAEAGLSARFSRAPTLLDFAGASQRPGRFSEAVLVLIDYPA